MGILCRICRRWDDATLETNPKGQEKLWGKEKTMEGGEGGSSTTDKPCSSSISRSHAATVATAAATTTTTTGAQPGEGKEKTMEGEEGGNSTTDKPSTSSILSSSSGNAATATAAATTTGTRSIQPVFLPPCAQNRSVDAVCSSSSTRRRDHHCDEEEARRARRRRRLALDQQQQRQQRQQQQQISCTTPTALIHYSSTSGAAGWAGWWWRRRYGSLASCTYPNGFTIINNNSTSSSSGSNNNDSHIVLDFKLWSNLPDDLVEKVLTWLPVPAFFRFRSVCKRWRSIMHTRAFADMSADVPPRGGHFFLKVARCRCRMLAAYYPAENKWLNIPISFLPSQVSVPAASSRGLVCFIATHYVDGYNVLLVCNPLTKCWKALPPMNSRRYPFLVSLVTDRKLKAYKVVVAGDYNSYDNRRTTEVYDSVTASWKTAGPLPGEEEMSKNIIVCNGYLFCLSRGPGRGLLAYSLQQEVWIKVRTGRMPGYSKFRHLLESKGRVIIVGKALRRQVLGLYVWQLELRTMKWREVGKMPQLLSEQFFRTPSECFFCSAYGDEIFITRFFCDLGLLYNITHDTWQLIPDCPKIANPYILTLEPGFDAVY